MRKIFTLLLVLAIGMQLMAQKGFQPVKRNLDFAQPNQVLKQEEKSKAPGDVIWSEDFDGADWSATSNNGVPVPANAPANWTLHDNTGNNFNWRWDTVGPRGIYTSPGDDCHEPSVALMSTTGSNGYIMLEADYFNTASDCSAFYDESLDCYFQYEGGIDFSGQTTIHLLFEQANRFCCLYGESSDAWFSISIDNGTTWNSISVSEAPIAYSLGVLGDRPYVSEFDITNMVVGHSNVWFRFHLLELSHYYWLVDDVMFIVPEDNDIQFVDYWNDYIYYRDGSDEYPLKETYDFTEGFYEYPWFLVQEYKGFHAAYHNFGGQPQTNFAHVVELWKDGALIEVFHSDTVANLQVGAKDTTMMEATVWPWQEGNYMFVHYSSMDATDDIPYNDTLRRRMLVSDSKIKVCDFSKVDNSISPDNWANYDEDGDGLGFKFNLPKPTLHGYGNSEYYVLDGAYLYIDSNNKEELTLFQTEVAKIIASVYQYNPNDSTYTEIISSAEYTLTINDTNSIVYIPFALDGTSEYIFEGGDFILAINMYGTWTNAFGGLMSWDIKNSSNLIQKRSPESCITVNASINDMSDVHSVFEGPALGLKMTYSGYNPPPPTYYVTYNVKSTNGNFIEGAKIELSGGIGGIKYTDSLGKAIFSYLGGWDLRTFFDYEITYPGYDTIMRTGMLEYGDLTYNITMNPVGIQNANKIAFSIYPNPSTGIFNIKAEGTYDLQILDVSGKLVYESQLVEMTQANLTNIDKGVYFVSLTQNGKQITKTIIIQ
jgi:hypothetical protein